VFCSVTLSASCTAIQGSPGITFFQYCDFLQQHTEILNEIQLSHIFHYSFLFSYFLPISFLFLTPIPLFSAPSIGPSFIVYMYVIHLSSTPLVTFMFLLSFFSHFLHTLFFLLLPFLRASSTPSFLYCFKISSFSFYFSSTFFCGHP